MIECEEREKEKEKEGKSKMSKKKKDLQLQLVAEGAETLQAAGRVMAFVIFKLTPRLALFLKASHKHSASVLSTDFSPEQQDPSGLFTVLPADTNDRQSAMLNTRVVQSTPGAGAAELPAE